MFQFSGFASRLRGILCLQHSGLPHSGACGSTRACQSPQLFAACRALLRLREPRHSPCALSYFRSIVCPEPFLALALAILACSRQALPRSPALLLIRTSKIVFPLREVAESGAASPTVPSRKPAHAGDPRALRHRGCSGSKCVQTADAARAHRAPERRCSSRTFRYGYLVTT